MLRIFTKLYLLLIRYLFSLSAPSILYVGWWCSLLARSPPTLFPLSELPQPPLLASALADVFRASHMQLSSRYQSQYRPQFLIPTLLEHCSHKSIVHHLPECSRDLSHSIPTFLGCGKRIKTSGGQFLSIVIQNVLWRPPYAHISIRAPTPRQKHEHICTIHRHTCTCLYIWMHMCTKKKKKKTHIHTEIYASVAISGDTGTGGYPGRHILRSSDQRLSVVWKWARANSWDNWKGGLGC